MAEVPAASAAPEPAAAPAVVADVAPAAPVAAAEAPAEPILAETPLAPEEPAAAEALTPPAEAAAESGAEAPKPDEAKPEAAKPEGESAAEAAPPTYADFKIPEGLTVPEDRLTEFTTTLGKYGLSQEAGQELLDLHASTVKQFADATAQNQRDVFDKTRQNWREDFFKTAGNRSNTIIEDAKFAIKESFRDPKDRAEFYQMLNFTGAGDHKGFLYSYAALGRRLRERGAPASPTPPKGVPMRAADRRYNRGARVQT